MPAVALLAMIVISVLITVYASIYFYTYNQIHAQQRDIMFEYVFGEGGVCRSSIENCNSALTSLYSVIAQQDVAQWNYSLTFVGVLGVVISIFGVILIYYTLHETRKAALAAEDTLLETRRVGTLQSDASIAIVSGKLEIPASVDRSVRSSHGVLTIKIKNTGYTVASDIEIDCWFLFRALWRGPGYPPPHKQYRHIGKNQLQNLEPGDFDEYIKLIQWQVLEENYGGRDSIPNLIADGHGRVDVVGTLKYKTVSGNEPSRNFGLFVILTDAFPIELNFHKSRADFGGFDESLPRRDGERPQPPVV